ncbi:MAG TPA: hypothetical protein VF079_00010 [Sphingomicrobium sp.]
MNRCLAFLLAVMFATITVSSACVAAIPSEWIAFDLRPESGDRIHADFRDQERDRDRSSWSTGFRPAELVGLDLGGFRGPGSRPLGFAIMREAGRLDCSGKGGDSHAYGNCHFTADPGFLELLARRGIGTPSREQAFGLMAVNARRDVIEALAAARFPTPTIDDLMGLGALGVDRRYIGELAAAGYRPRAIDTLVQFKALGVTPQWIGGFTRIGYGTIPADELVQLRALGITPDFVAGFNRIGYGRLPVSTLVQLKALGITPEFARSVGPNGRMSVDDLVEAKLFGHRR